MLAEVSEHVETLIVVAFPPQLVAANDVAPETGKFD